MVSENRSTPAVISGVTLRALATHLHRYEFFEAMRQVELAFPQLPRLGCAPSPKQEALRLHQEVHLGFAPASLARMAPPNTHDGPFHLWIHLFGLFGANGPLPLHLTEYVQQRQRIHGDDSLARFADMFLHRMALLWYRAWASSRPTIQYDRPQDDQFSIMLGSLMGVGQRELRDRMGLVAEAKLASAGSSTLNSCSAEGLEKLLGRFYEVPVEIDSFSEEWVALGEAKASLGSFGAQLGHCALGDRALHCQHRFHIRLGPLHLDRYQQLSTGKRRRQLAAIVRGYAGRELSFSVQLILRREEIPPLELTSKTDTNNVQLGQSTWLCSETATQDKMEYVYTPNGESVA